MDAGEFDAALPLLESLNAGKKFDAQVVFQMAFCQWRTGLIDEAEITLQHLLRKNGTGPLYHYLQGMIDLEAGRPDRAVEQFDQTVSDLQGLHLPGLGHALARAYFSLGRWTDAEEVLRLALEREPENGFLHQGLARSLLAQERFEEAANSAMDAVALHHNLPWAHLFLGQSLSHLNETASAGQAFRTALQYRPDFEEALQELAAFLEESNGAANEIESLKNRVAEAAAESHGLLVEERRRAAAERTFSRMDDLWNRPQPDAKR